MWMAVSLIYSMRSQTRLSRFFNNLLGNFKDKFLFFQNSFSSAVFFLFIGFLGGNLFGTFLTRIRTLFPWDGFIVLSFLFFIEIISYSRYHREGRSFFVFSFLRPTFGFWSAFGLTKASKKLGIDQPLVDQREDREDQKASKMLTSKRLVDNLPLIGNKSVTSKDVSRTVPIFFKTRVVWKILNFLKIGLMVGFFIDAFKVGS